jgi:hypothetical protein
MPVDLSGLNRKAPPQKTTRSAPRKATISNKHDARKEAVLGLFSLGQFAAVSTNNPADAAAIGMHGENISQEVANLADVDERIAKSIDWMLQAGPYAGLITACLPLVMQILANHKRIPVNVPGVLPPEVLAAKYEAEMQKQALEVMAEARQSQQEYQEAMASAALADAMRDHVAYTEATQNGSGHVHSEWRDT